MLADDLSGPKGKRERLQHAFRDELDSLRAGFGAAEGTTGAPSSYAGISGQCLEVDWGFGGYDLKEGLQFGVSIPCSGRGPLSGTPEAVVIAPKCSEQQWSSHGGLVSSNPGQENGPLQAIIRANLARIGWTMLEQPILRGTLFLAGLPWSRHLRAHHFQGSWRS